MNKAFFIPRTDLAAERHRADLSIPGVRYTKTAIGNIESEWLDVSSAEGAESIGKPCGRYVTYSFPALSECDEETRSTLSSLIAERLLDCVTRLTGKSRIKELSVLAVGLGNRNMTADRIGSATAERIHATAHIRDLDPPLFEKMGCAAVSVVTPGVLGDSGIEAADRVRALIPYLHPDAVIVFDALAARAFSRVGRTVQIADTGIAPGSGIGNHRRAITRATVGVPVIAVGMPTVTDTKTLLSDAFSEIDDDTLTERLVALTGAANDSFVSPSDCDLLVNEAAVLLSDAVNATFGVSL